MQKALEEGWEEVCYLDSDCIATPIVDELFDWSTNITNYPLATEGIHQYVMFTENGVEFTRHKIICLSIKLLNISREDGMTFITSKFASNINMVPKDQYKPVENDVRFVYYN